ncbi:hypothetical protein L7H23_17725 [Sphingopyxis sp. BSN-002]|uniref:hypothetical protein n=1 Tax=Sphingopyxis sp. BSN-002 TaxID=2911495 RepID=UPI001EDB6815|nr:hypothetical protein [Sphingopyxis sp. BSN-002]UKK84386.1 hypothetical protein L7H23_17725 [Sphingopyxis sp. BSN-002]
MNRLAFSAALILAACSMPELKPTEAEMDRVETALRQKPCIGKLADWERRYYYQLQFSSDKSEKSVRKGLMPKPTGYDRSIVEIDLRQANFEEFGSGRGSYADYPPGAADTDDREYNLAFGTYSLETGELHLAHCGPNM